MYEVLPSIFGWQARLRCRLRKRLVTGPPSGGQGTELAHRERSLGIGRGEPREPVVEHRLAEGPRRGRKPRKEQGAASPATVERAPGTRRWSKASRSTLRSRRIGRGRLWQRRRGRPVRHGRRERRGGNGRGDAVRLSQRFFEGMEASRGMRRTSRKQAGLGFAERRCGEQETRRTPVGSGMQQARDLRAEEPVEVVRNHEDGTGFRGWHLGTEAGRKARGSGRSAGESTEGSTTNPKGGGRKPGPGSK